MALGQKMIQTGDKDQLINQIKDFTDGYCFKKKSKTWVKFSLVYYNKIKRFDFKNMKRNLKSFTDEDVLFSEIYFD